MTVRGIMNKIKMINTKISLINNTGTPPNSPRKSTPTITDSGANIHQANEATQTMSPVIISKKLLQGYQMEAQWIFHM